MGARIGFVIVIVIILGVALYAYNSGVAGHYNGGSSSSTASNFFSSLFPHWSTSTSGSYSGFMPKGYNGSGFSNTTGMPTSTIGPVINPTDIPAGFTESQLSSYFHQVRFGTVYAGNGYYSSGQISLNTYLYQQSSTGISAVNVTGWQIKSNRGGEFIPQAVNLYDPTGLAPATDIYLKNGDYLNIYSSSAPVNVRINKCMGYLPNGNQFNPPLPQNCPYLDKSQIQSFSGACQNYIMSLSACQLPDFSNPAMPQNDFACRDYINNHFSYHSCFNDHQTDPDSSYSTTSTKN